MKQIDMTVLNGGERERFSTHVQRDQLLVVLAGSAMASVQTGRWKPNPHGHGMTANGSRSVGLRKLRAGDTIAIPMSPIEIGSVHTQVDVTASDRLELLNVLSEAWTGSGGSAAITLWTAMAEAA